MNSVKIRLCLSVTCRVAGYAEISWLKMKKSEKVPELKVLPTTNSPESSLPLLGDEVTSNQIVHKDIIQTTCMDADYYQSPYKGGQLNQERGHVGLMQHAEPEERGATAAGTNLYHQPLHSCCLRPAQIRHSECCCWDSGLSQCGTADSENKNTHR